MKRYLDSCSSTYAFDLFVSSSVLPSVNHDRTECLKFSLDPNVAVVSETHYPLVVLSVTSQNTTPRGLLSVYHIKNPSNTRNTSLLFQFIICADGVYYPLKKVFLSNELCVVCQVQKSEICLLPCGHRCVCRACCFMIKLKCPVCRTDVSKTILNSNFQSADEVAHV